NEIHLAAFREHPEFPSFRGRIELVRAPYLKSWLDELSIYDAQIAPFVNRHVAPHATRVAAQFAVLTRMRQPEAKRYSDALATTASSATWRGAASSTRWRRRCASPAASSTSCATSSSSSATWPTSASG